MDPRIVCVLVSTFAPRPMIHGVSKNSLKKRITTIVAVFRSYEDYLSWMQTTTAEKIEKYARCKLNVEHKRLPYIYDYEETTPRMEYSNNLLLKPYRIFQSPYFDQNWDLEKDPLILTTDPNVEEDKTNLNG